MKEKENFIPEDGDIIVVQSNTDPYILMFKEMSEYGRDCFYYAACYKGAESPFRSGVDYKGRRAFVDARPATVEERGFFIRRLKMDGITYNYSHKLMKIDDRPRDGQTYYYIDSFLCVCEDVWGRGGSEQQFRWKADNCFLNLEDAEDMQIELRRVLRKMKKGRMQNDKRDELI